MNARSLFLAAVLAVAAVPAVQAEPIRVTSAEDKGNSKFIYFKNCSEARAAGYSNMRVGEPGYASHLDRDKDGIACETR